MASVPEELNIYFYLPFMNFNLDRHTVRTLLKSTSVEPKLGMWKRKITLS